MHSNGSPSEDRDSDWLADMDEETLALMAEERARLAEDSDSVLAEAFSQHRDSFWYLVTFRMDRRLTQRVDPDDVLQEAFLAAKSRLEHFIAAEKYTLFAWLRMIVVQTLFDVHRRHLGAEKRSAGREVQLGAPRFDTHKQPHCRLLDVSLPTKQPPVVLPLEVRPWSYWRM